MMTQLQVGNAVQITEDCGDGGDEWAVGLNGVITHIEDNFAEVQIGNETKTHLFALWQLTQTVQP